MAESTRAAGWYPDPWGTDHERYFDGLSWSRQTRVVGSNDTVEVHAAYVDPAANAPTGPMADAPRSDPPADTDRDVVAGTTAPSVPPGWHRDPWGLASLRWWDGAIWTGHVSGPPKGRAVDVVGERTLARWLRPALLFGGIAQAAGLFVAAEQYTWLADHWDEFVESGRIPGQTGGTLGALGQLALPIGVAVSVLFLLWFYRAASTAWASQLPARRSPILATLSFFIPVLNLWWPYSAALDMVPATDARRSLIGRWWVLWLLATLATPLIFAAAAISGATAARIVAAFGAVATVGAAFAARAVVEYVTSTHEQLSHQAAAAG